MTDLERVREYLSNRDDWNWMSDAITAHLKEDAEREKELDGYKWLAGEMQNRNAQNVQELCQRLRDAAEQREGNANAAMLERDVLQAELAELREAVRDWAKHADDYDRVNRLRQLIEEKP